MHNESCSASSQNEPCKIPSHGQSIPQLPSLDVKCVSLIITCLQHLPACMTRSYSPYSQIRHNTAHVPVPTSLAPCGAFAARLAIVTEVLRGCLVRGRLSIAATPDSTPAELDCAVAVLHLKVSPSSVDAGPQLKAECSAICCCCSILARA